MMKSNATWGKESVFTHREYLVAPPDLPTQVGGPPSQDEGHEDALPILPTHDVEPQARVALLQYHLPRLPRNTRGKSYKYGP